jgi:hypothetical protein
MNVTLISAIISGIILVLALASSIRELARPAPRSTS